jgi:hypothetical protein
MTQCSYAELFYTERSFGVSFEKFVNPIFVLLRVFE